MVAKGLGRRPTRRPALDPERDDLAPAGKRTSQRIGEGANRRVILQHEELLVPANRLLEPVGIDAIQPRHRKNGESEPLRFE